MTSTIMKNYFKHKSNMQKSLLFSLAALAGSASAQTVSTFEEKTISTNSYWDGSDYAGGFTSGNAFFDNYYDTTWGASSGYWASGWAVSNIYDTLTQPSSFSQLYRAKEIAPSSSYNFAVGTQNSKIILTGSAIGKVINGFHITNSTYAYNSMRLGDSFAKKFGGPSGNDPDYFKLVIQKYYGGSLTADSVEFYLADFRFSDNSQDYIVDEWTWVDLTGLGNCDSLLFILRSTDAGSFGINTPLYYCIDNFTTANSLVNVNEINEQNHDYTIYPNPFSNALNVKNADSKEKVVLTDGAGRLVLTTTVENINHFDLSSLDIGIYFIRIGEKSFTLSKI